MPRSTDKSKPRKRTGRPKGSKNKPKPVVVEAPVEEIVEAAGNAELEAILAKINPAFDWQWTVDGMANAAYGLNQHLHYLKQNVHPSQIAYHLAESPHYAKYRLAERFGLVSEPIEEMALYGTVKSKHLEVLGI